MQKEKTSPWLIAFRVIFTIALLACICFIFRNSMEVAAVSSGRSQAVMEKINAVLGRVRLGPLSEHTVRKLAHFAEYMLEGFLLMLCLRVYTQRFVRHLSWPLLGGMTTALLDETIQLGSAGRSAQVTDVWLDTAGVGFGLIVALILLLIVRGIAAFYEVKSENRRLRAEREELMRQRKAEKRAPKEQPPEHPNRREYL